MVQQSKDKLAARLHFDRGDASVKPIGLCRLNQRGTASRSGKKTDGSLPSVLSTRFLDGPLESSSLVGAISCTSLVSPWQDPLKPGNGTPTLQGAALPFTYPLVVAPLASLSRLLSAACHDSNAGLIARIHPGYCAVIYRFLG